MSQLIDTLLTDLRTLIADLGKDGGLISPSVYDTAQVLRFCPPEEGVEPALEWILGQQQPDGGWGNPYEPLYRDVPTLAAILTLHIYKNSKKMDAAITAGLTFIDQQADQWQEPLSDRIPAGIEFILPKLIKDAEEVNLQIPLELHQKYKALINQGNKKRRYISQIESKKGSVVAHSWEAWGTKPHPTLLDQRGSIGLSPAATAAWLKAAEKYPELNIDKQIARNYLVQASGATGLDIPGVVPTAWPIERFEQAFGLYALLMADLLTHPALYDLISLHLCDLYNALTLNGLGASDDFVPDGDNTAAAIAVLFAAEHKINFNILKKFQKENIFISFPSELHWSPSVTARSIHALQISGENVEPLQAFLVKCQNADGRWMGDKWHMSWIYTTCHMIFALMNSKHQNAINLAVNALLYYQNIDGGWGMHAKSTNIETAYVLFVLNGLSKQRILNDNHLNALQRGYEWLRHNYFSINVMNQKKMWVAKELYSPYRVDRAFELSAILALTMREVSS